MKNRMRAIIVLVLIIAGYLIYNDNQKLQTAIDAIEKSEQERMIQESTKPSTVSTGVDNNNILSGDTLSGDIVTGDLTQGSIDAPLSGTSAE